MRITVAFAVCWISGLAASMEPGNREIVLLASAAMIGVLARLMTSRSWRPLAVCIVFLLCGSLYGYWQQSTNKSGLPESGLVRMTGTITGPIEKDGDRVRFEFETISNQQAERLMVTGRLFEPEERIEVMKWRRGNIATLEGELSLPAQARNFGQFDYARFLSRQGIHRTLTVEGTDKITVTRQEGWTLYKALGYLDFYRAGLANRVEMLFPGEQSGFMQGMLIGVRANMAESLFDRFSRLGLTHIIAISGMHVAIVIGGWLWLLRMFKVTRETALLSAMFLIPAYVLLAGASPSIVRAGIMAMIAVYATRRGWLKDALQLLALTSILMTVWNPYYMYDVGFQLSFVVTAGLISGVPTFRRVLPARPGWLYNAAAVALVAQMVSFPLTVYYFNQFSLLSAFANLALVPIFSLIALPLGYAALLLSYVYMPVGYGLAITAGWCNELCFWLINRLDEFSGPFMIWPSPSIGSVALFYAILYVVLVGIGRLKADRSELFPRYRRIGKGMLLCGGAALSVWLLYSYESETWGSEGTIAFLDVGQGDSILVRTPDDRTMLIDGGGTLRFQKNGEEWRSRSDPYEVGKDLLVPLLKKRGVRQIDYMVATHADADHVGGLAAVMENIPVKRLLFNGTLKDSPFAVRLFQLAIERHIPLYPLSDGQTLQIDDRTQLSFLYPLTEEGIRFEEEQNGASVVFLMEMYDKRFLFTGDMDESAERQVLAGLREEEEEEKTTHIDLLKIAHHGSKTSTSEVWLDYWRPQMAVISVGARNVYRHPSPVVTDRLAERSIPVFRTDRHGEIQIMVGAGKELRFRNRISISY